MDADWPTCKESICNRHSWRALELYYMGHVSALLTHFHEDSLGVKFTQTLKIPKMQNKSTLLQNNSQEHPSTAEYY